LYLRVDQLVNLNYEDKPAASKASSSLAGLYPTTFSSPITVTGVLLYPIDTKSFKDSLSVDTLCSVNSNPFRERYTFTIWQGPQPTDVKTFIGSLIFISYRYNCQLYLKSGIHSNPSRLFFLVIFSSAFIKFFLTGSVFKKLCSQRHSLIYSLSEIFSCFILAKKLFADEEHSYTKAIPFNVLVMAFTRTNLLAILNWIATQWHSRTISISLKPMISS